MTTNTDNFLKSAPRITPPNHLNSSVNNGIFIIYEIRFFYFKPQ